MTEKILNFIEELKKKPQISKLDETEAKQAMILPVLQLLGWNVWDTEEVKPEYPVEGKKAAEGGKVDYCLRIKRKSEVFLEAKRPGEDLEKHQEQLLDYSFREGVDIAILTNGISWWFYLPRKKGHWKERKFFSIDIIQQDTNEVAEIFTQLLSHSNVKSGEGLQSAKLINEQQEREKKIAETLPKAWNKIIIEADSRLFDLLADTTESMCGFRPENGDLKDMILNFEERLILPETELAEPIIIEGTNVTSNCKSPYGHRPGSQVGQIDMLWHGLKGLLDREPSAEEISEASNKTLIVSRVTAHLSYWKKRGRYAAENMEVATWKDQEEKDILQDFITKHCLIIPEECTAAKDLYQAYLKWATLAGKKKPLSKRAFGICLGKRGFQSVRGTAGIRLWRGISLSN